MADEERIADLLVKQLRHSLSTEEKEELEAWTRESGANRQYVEDPMRRARIWSGVKAIAKKDDKAIIKKINRHFGEQMLETPIVHFTSWYVGRAAVVLLLAAAITGAYILHHHSQMKQLSHRVQPELKEIQDTDRIRMILSDSTTIFLDTIPVGTEFEASGWWVSKTDSQHIAYSRPSQAKGKDISYHTLTTPYGQSFYVSLPDSSQIQLNAATFMRYSIMRAGVKKGKREVSLEGEAYFTVAKNKQLPFVVKTPKVTVTVLSTDFDVLDYPDRGELRVALVKGAVKVSDGKTTLKLRPGEAVRIDSSLTGMRKIDKYDTDKELAWRSKFFDFTDLNIKQSMEALGHWYGKQIFIMPGVDTVSPGLLSAGLIRKGWDLNKLLNNLGKAHHLRLYSEGNKIVVYPM